LAVFLDAFLSGEQMQKLPQINFAESTFITKA
jgi:hypothetical protein